MSPPGSEGARRMRTMTSAVERLAAAVLAALLAALSPARAGTMPPCPFWPL